MLVFDVAISNKRLTLVSWQGLPGGELSRESGDCEDLQSRAFSFIF